jgi:protein ImuB
MFGCIHIPDFSVQAALCGESTKQSLDLIDGPESLLKVIACNASARSAGVKVGMTKLQAEACCIEVRKRVQEQEDSAQAILLDCAYAFSPRIEATGPGTIILDLNGTERLFGDCKTIADRIHSQVTERGFNSNVSIAVNSDAAHCAAKGFAGITIIPPGQEAQRLDRLPIEVLELEPDVMDVLDAWGIHDLKSLAGLPTIPLTESLGQCGLQLQVLARGAASRELISADLHHYLKNAPRSPRMRSAMGSRSNRLTLHVHNWTALLKVRQISLCCALDCIMCEAYDKR